MNRIDAEDQAGRAEKLARLSSACRQAGAMMEAGVDILSITRILRAQTEDEDILRLCDRIDFDLKQGRALAEALSGEPELFSPFMVTLIRQGEERATLPQAFARVSSALDAERHELLQSLSLPASRPSQAASAAQDGTSGQGERPQVLAGAANAPSDGPRPTFEARSWPQSEASAAQAERSRARWLRAASSIGAGLLAASAAAEALGALGLGAKWQRPLSKALSAGVLALAALQARKMEAQHSSVTPQVLAGQDQAVPAAQTAPAAQASQGVEAGEDSARSGVEAGAEEELTQAAAPSRESVPRTADAPQPEAPGSDGVYRGAPREDEEEVPRQVRRPRQEEEFD